MFKYVEVVYNKSIYDVGCDEEKWPYRDAIKAAEKMGARVENKASV